MKKVLIGFVIYYGLGFVLLNALAISRFLESANIFEIGPKIITQNISDPAFWGLSLFGRYILELMFTILPQEIFLIK